MINKRILSTLLALAILLSCVGWTPAQAQGTAPEEETIDNVTQTLDNEDSPEYVDAEQFEEAGHVQRLYDEEELDTYVYLNADGSKSVYYMDQDVKFIDEQGNVREKDTALVRKERGYGMHSNDVGLHIPDSAADGITVSHKSREVKLLPVGGTGLAAANNNSILYSNFFGRGIHLQYTPMLSGVKEDVIITKYTGVNSFSFLLETGGLYLLDADGRYYLAESATAKAAFYLGEVLVYDAIGRPDMGTMVVETITPGQRYKLTISANEAFLTDPETLYPVTVDPTLTVSDNTHGAGAIEDAPVFSGKPNKNFGSYVYNTIGYHSADYGTAMTVVRLAGLLSDDIYESLSESNIENVTFYMKDGGSSSATVNIHAVTGSATWTESNVTYSNLGAYSTAIYATDTMGGGGWGEFNITYLVRLWKNGTLNPQRGFVMAISDSTKKIGALSSEYSNTDYRPYVVVTYTLPPGIEIAVDEGNEIQLNTNMTGTITWTSSDESLATVSSNGLVEGIRAGKVTITASCSNHEFSTYTVYVTVPDGVYYFKNQSSNLCLQGTVGRLHINSQKTSQDTRLNQLWKITYLQNGQYVIRPMQNLSKALTVDSGGYVTVANASSNNSAVTSAYYWTISYNANGYAVQQNGSPAKTVTPVVSSMPDSAVYAGTWSESASCHWNLDRTFGVFLRDTNTLEVLNSSTVKTVELGTTPTLASLNIQKEVFGLSTESDFYSINETIADTDISDMSINGMARGRTTIVVSEKIKNNRYMQQFQIVFQETISLINLYDCTLVGDAENLGYISEAVSFLNKIYNPLYLFFVEDGAPIWYTNSAQDTCPTGTDAPCHILNTECTYDCTSHHKNANRIAEELYITKWERNHLVVMWSNSTDNVFCVNAYDEATDSYVHTPITFLGMVCSNENREIGYPVIQIATFDAQASIYEYLGTLNVLERLSITLAHEVAHTLGLHEIYTNSYNDDPNLRHQTGYTDETKTEKFYCIMTRYNPEDGSALYRAINEGTHTGLCDYCLSKLPTGLNAYEE